MDPYQEKALGVTPQSEIDHDEASQHKISTAAAVILVIVAVLLDIASVADVAVAEVPIADILAWIVEVPMFIYFLYVGASQGRQIAANLLAWVVEFVPVLDFLPFYLLGIVLVIVFDRNETLARLASKIPQPKSVGGGLAAGGGKAGSRLSQNKMFGGASQGFADKLQKAQEHTGRLQERVPGILRTAAAQRLGGAGQTALGEQLAQSNSGSGRVRTTPGTQVRTTPGAQARPTQSTPSGDLRDTPFPDTYYQYERELLPELSDVVNVDVSGDRLSQTSPDGRGNQNQVQYQHASPRSPDSGASSVNQPPRPGATNNPA